jgi:hypothetical protein
VEGKEKHDRRKERNIRERSRPQEEDRKGDTERHS